jgi:predicted nucleic acid-binding protein
MRGFLDANILFSAAYRDRSELLVFFDLARAGVVELCASAFAIEEGRRNIALKRPDRLATYECLIACLALAPPPAGEHLAIAEEAGLPPKDAPILAAALAADADVLVTGDRTHFGHLFGRPIGQLVVHRPTDALSTILGDARQHPGRRKSG